MKSLIEAGRECVICGTKQKFRSKDRPRIVTVQLVAYMIGARMTAGTRVLVCEDCIVKGAIGDVKKGAEAPAQIGRALTETLGRVYREMAENSEESPDEQAAALNRALAGAQTTL